MSEREIRSSIYIDEDLLQAKIKKGLEPWAIEQIKEDLSYFKNQALLKKNHPLSKKNHAFSKKDLLQYFKENKTKRIFYVVIQKRKVTMTMHHASSNQPPDSYHQIWNKGDLAYPVIYDALQYLAQKNYLPDTEFLLGLGDYIPNHNPDSNIFTANANANSTPLPSEISVPIFTFARDNQNSFEKHLILFPDWMNLRFSHSNRKEIQIGRENYPFEKKKPLVFWRGGNWDSSGFRKKLVAFASLYPDLIDARFVTDQNQEKAFVSLKDHLQYKYQISIDGQRATWERLVWQLYSNSLVLKHESHQVQWFYKGIKPFQHYLPIKDEHSLIELREWAEANPKEVQDIIANANQFANNNLSLEDMYHYIIVLLQEYNKMMEEQEV